MTSPTSRFRRLLLLLALATLVASILPAAMQAATIRPVRLEAGPHSGIRFSSTGAVLERKNISLSSPANYQSDRRRVVPNRTGIFIRLSSGPLAGWEVRESMVAYIPGKVGDTAYAAGTTATLGANRYLAYKFDTSYRIAGTRYGTTTSTSVAVTRRAVIHGRPFLMVASGTWSGYWMPAAAPRTLRFQPLTCGSPGHVAAGTQQVFRVLPGAVNQVALTFDMGGRITPGLDIVNRLLLDRVCTTFFPTGAMTATTDGQKIVNLIGKHPYLFELGNHTQHHCNLRDGGGGSPTTAPCPKSAPSSSFIVKELKDAEAILKTASGGMNPVPYWRAPYGAYNSSVLAAATSAGYTKSFMWDVDTIDWRPVSDGGPTAGYMANKVVVNAVNGSNVLMHLGGWNTYDALPSMVHRLRTERGLQPTTISDILR